MCNSFLNHVFLYILISFSMFLVWMFCYQHVFNGWNQFWKVYQFYIQIWSPCTFSVGFGIFFFLMPLFVTHCSLYVPLLPVLLMLYCLSFPEAGSQSLSFLFYRLEDQTKKLHKDMKKSTEADLGVFYLQRVCCRLVGHWSTLVHQHTWCCLAGFRG